MDPDVIYLRHDTDLDDRTLAALKDLATVARFVGVSDRPDVLTASDRDELRDLLLADPQTRDQGRYLWDIDNRRVDFSWVLSDRSPVRSVAER